MKFSIAVSFITFLSCMGIGFFVFLRKKSVKNILFLIFNLNLAVWAATMVMVITSWQNIRAIATWVRIATSVSMFLPANLYCFATSVTGETRLKRKEIVAWYLISLLCVGIAFIPSFIKQAFFSESVGNPVFSSPEAAYGKLFIFMALYVIGLLGHTIFYLWQSKKTSYGLRRVEIEYILLGILIGATFVTFTSIVSPYLGISQLTLMGPFSAVLMSAVIAYGIARYKILDVSFFLEQTVLYSFLTISLVLVYSLVIFVFNLIFKRFIPTNSLLPNMIATVAIAFLFSPVKEKSQIYLDKFFFRRRRQPEKVLSELSEILSSREDISRLLRLSLERIAPALKVKNVLVALRGNKEADNFFIGAMVGQRFEKNQLILELKKESAFIKELARGDILIRDELERMSSTPGRDQVSALLKAMSAEMAVPLMIKNELVGFLVISQKENWKVFSKHDLEFLRTISSQLAMVINNSELFSQLQRAERLAAAGIIAAGMAHEIRNPLVSIKTFVQLLPEKFNDPEFRQTFTKIASQEVDRINRLLEDLLNFARPAPMQKKKTNLSGIMEKSLFMLSNELAARKIIVEKEYLKNDVFVEGDEFQLQRVFSNLFLNSIQAMENGGRLTITASTSPYKQRFFIKIIDTGKGIPSENLSRIFDPFFSTRHGGNGLGLAIAHNIVKEHGGEIEVQSAPNSGTTFTLEFPGAYSTL
ncbi:MAG: ATP-binding protein [Candidatus Ratteibacteria bacterium]|jgi:signal transduction histidine kinase